MNRRCRTLIGRACAINVCLFVFLAAPMRAAVLEISITPHFAGEPLQLNSLRYTNTAGERFSVTRLSWLLSGFALQRTDGSWFEISNTVAWLDAERSRASFTLAALPTASYSAVRFLVGLSPTENHADISKYAADHPLNPNLNGLHWSWQGGYVFLAMEGLWRNGSGALDGWSYHLARDTNRVPIILAAAIDLQHNARLDLDFDIASLLNAPRPLAFVADGSSTHSRNGDPLAAALMANVPSAFELRRVTAALAQVNITQRAKPLYLPETFTPYRFQVSSSFPIPDLPQDNPLTQERVELGQHLFNEPLLSRDETVSCASCHDPKRAFSDSLRFSRGVGGQSGARNAMPLFNLAWKHTFFWDGRAPSLRAQALMPIQDAAEMGESLTNVASKLARVARTDYPALFNAAFGSPEITPQKLGLALEAFLLTLTSCDSKLDRALRGEAKLMQQEQKGFELFSTEYDPRRGQFGADCFHCHGGPLFQSQSFANNGLDAEPKDSGRAKVTGKESDVGKFAVPSLRNVSLTGPYMHDGRFKTLEEVVEHYSTGVKRSATLDPNLAKHPDGGVPLRVADKQALVAFLKTLADERFFMPQGNPPTLVQDR